jgi:hypothetical protein
MKRKLKRLYSYEAIFQDSGPGPHVHRPTRTPGVWVWVHHRDVTSHFDHVTIDAHSIAEARKIAQQRGRLNYDLCKVSCDPHGWGGQCGNGHRSTAVSTYRDADGNRHCRVCEQQEEIRRLSEQWRSQKRGAACC